MSCSHASLADELQALSTAKEIHFKRLQGDSAGFIYISKGVKGLTPCTWNMEGRF